MKLDVVVSGVGGQGVLTLARVLTRAAVREGFEAHALTHSGLAQLGSPTLAHVRVGTPAGPSPKVPRGRADFVVGLERMEALRLAPYLSSAGVALLSEEAVRPYEARFRRDAYPGLEDVEAAFGAARVRWISAPELAAPYGSPGLVSAVMLGALAGSTPIVERENLVICLREARPEDAEAEVEAFFEGYRAITGTED